MPYSALSMVPQTGMLANVQPETPAAGSPFGNLSGLMSNPAFMGGLALLLGGMQKKRRQTPVEDLMSGMGMASSMQTMQQQKDLYKIQKEKIAEAQKETERQEQMFNDLTSGDPERIRKAAIMAAPKAFAKTQFEKPEESAFAEKLRLAGIDPDTPEGQAYVQKMLTKPMTQVNVGMGKPITAGEFQKETETLISDRMANQIEALVDKGVDIGSAAAAKAAASASPWTSWAVGDINSDETDMYSLIENYGNLLLAAMRGAQVGPMEQTKFEKSLPRLGQKKELFLSNLKITQENIKYLLKRARERRQELGQQPTPMGVPAPAGYE